MSEDREPLATSEQVAKYLSISPRTLDDMCHKRTGPPYVKVGRARRFRWADVDAWLAEREHDEHP